MPIHHSTITAVKSQARVEEVIARFVTLTRKGQNLWACCPFHHERTPSFAVSPARNSYKCFGCNKSGNAIQFLMDHENLDYVGAIRELAQQYNIPIRETTASHAYNKAQQERASLHILLALATNYYKEQLTNSPLGHQALAYCTKRHIPTALITQFELGYSTVAQRGLYQFATGKGYQDDLLVKAGLIISKPGEVPYDRFRARLLFPIHNLAGKVIALGGRLINNNTRQPKYINSPETSLYQKSKTLYGIYHAKKAILKNKNCYLVEGYTDVLAFHRQGIHHVVATAGTALTASHVQLLRRFTQKITLVFDADAAGQTAASKGADLILAQGLTPQLISLPVGEDPASYANQITPQALKDFLETQAKDIVTFKAQQCTTQDPSAKAAAIHDILKSIAQVTDPIQRTTYLQRCSEHFGISMEVLNSTPHHLITQQVGRRRLSFTKLPAEARHSLLTQFGKNIFACEQQLITLLLRYGNHKLPDGTCLATYLIEEVQDIPIQDEHHQHIIDLFRKYETIPDTNTLIQTEPEPIRNLIINLTVDRHHISPHWEKRYDIYTAKETDNLLHTTYQSVLNLKYRHVQKLAYETQQKLAQTEDPETQVLLLLTCLQLNDTKKKMAKELGTVVAQLAVYPATQST